MYTLSSVTTPARLERVAIQVPPADCSVCVLIHAKHIHPRIGGLGQLGIVYFLNWVSPVSF